MSATYVYRHVVKRMVTKGMCMVKTDEQPPPMLTAFDVSASPCSPTSWPAGVPIVEARASSANVMTVRVGTDALGGDGSTTVFELETQDGIPWELQAGGDVLRVTVFGSCECATLVACLKWAAEQLERMAGK